MGRSGARNTTGSHNGYVRRKQVDDVASLPLVRSATIEQIYFPKPDADGNRWPETVTDKEGNEVPAYKVFTIARATDENTGKRVMLKGGFGPVCEGELVNIAEGKWKVDGRYGPFFQVYRLSLEEPVTRQSLVHFLQKLPGVGEKLAEAIADTLGQKNGAFDGRQVLKAIDKDPQILRTVRTAAGRGLGGALDELISRWEELRGNQMAYLFLGSLGVGDADAEKIARWFGPDKLVPALKANPYAVCEVPGIGFRKADHLGRKLGIGFDDPRRLAYGVEHVLKEIEQGGHVCLTRAEILAKAPPMLADGNRQIPVERVEKVVEDMLADGRLVAEVEPSDGIERIYSKELWTIETRLYRKLHGMLLEQKQPRPANLRKPADSNLTDEQWQAVEQSFRERVSIITGGPGVGKTSTLKGVLDAMDGAGQKYTLLAPTGKAAKRMEEQTGRSASTIHRRLGYAGLATPHDTDHEPREAMLSKIKVGEKPGYGPNGRQGVYERCDAVVIDESSMLDLRLAERVLTHLGPDTRLILVGDPDQLPPVGAGSLLLDLLASDRVPTTKLTKVFRQAEDSLLVVNAHRIRQGLEPYWTKQEAEAALQREAKAAGDPDWAKIRVKEDFRFVEASDERDATVKSLEAIAEDAREFGVPETEVMAMSPFRKGESGVYQMNRELQNKHNPHGVVIRGGELEQIRLYDQVMNTSNRYANSKSTDYHDIFNGDVGKIVEWEPELKRAWVDFGQGPQPYSGEELDALVPAYCATVHKRQGLEAPVAVFTCPKAASAQSPRRLSRQALYTAITRAKERATLVGAKDAIRAALAHDGSQRGTVLDLRIGRIEPRLRSREEIEQDVKERWQNWAAQNNVPTSGRAITAQNFKALAKLRAKKQAAAAPAAAAVA